ncbi:M24 family metallopeptidase [Halobacteriales archaeon Cl-PHB]
MVSRLPESEYRDRLASVRDRLAAEDYDAGLWFDATSIEYLTGFAHIPTERPVALAVTADRIAITVPRLEVERVEDTPRIRDVHHYDDYPGGDPMGVVAQMLAAMDATAIAADAEAAPGVMGYEGPSLVEAAVRNLAVDVQDWVPRMRWEKSPAEVALVRESARWATLGHRHLAEFADAGAHPVTVSQRASLAASRAMLDTLGEDYVPRTRGDGPVHAGFISGEQTRLPHGHTANRTLEPGDVLVTGATATVDGYHAELERTMFVGEPSDDQRHYFAVMCEAQRLAIEACGPGVPIAHVDDVVQDYLAEQGVADLAQHHVGHNIGMAAHEPPYVDSGWGDHCESDATSYDADDAVMQPGHVWTIEPGLYTDAAGYRHSDTVAVTDDGVDRLTYFPRDLETNTLSLD